MCSTEDLWAAWALPDPSLKSKSPFWQVRTTEPCVLVEDHTLPLFHRGPQSPFPSTGLCSSVWDSLNQLLLKSWLSLHGFWHCPGHSSLPLVCTLHRRDLPDLVTIAGSNEHISWHKVGMQQTFANERKGSFRIRCLKLDGRLQARLCLLYLHYLLLATEKLTTLSWA